MAENDGFDDKDMSRLWFWATLAAVVCLVLLSTGCASTHTVYVPSGKAVRLREPVYAAIWALDAQGKPVPGHMTLPEGWYVLPDPGEIE